MLRGLLPRRESLQTHRDVVEWQATVLPLLNFNRRYHRKFLKLGAVLATPDLSSDAYDPAFREMERILLRAISDLERTEARNTE